MKGKLGGGGKYVSKRGKKGGERQQGKLDHRLGRRVCGKVRKDVARWAVGWGTPGKRWECVRQVWLIHRRAKAVSHCLKR